MAAANGLTVSMTGRGSRARQAPGWLLERGRAAARRNMTSSFKAALSRLIRNPLAIVGAIGSLLVVLANANPAIDGASNLWRRWMHRHGGLETHWQGTWKSRDGWNFAFAMRLDVHEDESADGAIRWELVATPEGSFLANRVGSSATEYVTGRFDKADNVATVAGYKVSDPTLLALDSYKFQIKSDKVSFIGMSKHRGEWEAEAQGTVIVSEKD